MQKTLKEFYNEAFAKQALIADAPQEKLIEELQAYKTIIELPNAKKKTLLEKIGFAKSKVYHPHQGIYIWGGVGRGKSMLMNIFCESLQIKQKAIIHFHQFMLNFHKELSKLQQSDSSDKKDYVEQIASQIASYHKVLCLDELQINNIADAMIVERIFQHLLSRGVFIFFTSNRMPQDLFKDGLQRERFEPFIELINNKLLTFNLDNFMDYRLAKLANSKQTYLSPLNSQNSKKLDEIVADLVGHKPFVSQKVYVDNNYSLEVHKACNKVAVFTFNELCEVPLGAIDYIALCKNFNTIVIKDIPLLNTDNHNEALRFITLIDCMYDHHTRLVCTANADVNALYQAGRNQFEFGRTVSRLLEMQSADYIMKMPKAQEQAA